MCESTVATGASESGPFSDKIYGRKTTVKVITHYILRKTKYAYFIVRCLFSDKTYGQINHVSAKVIYTLHVHALIRSASITK